MSRIALFNMFFGFLVLTLMAAAGAFIADEATEALLKDPALINSWGQILRRSAHGHSNLFGVMHILFALTVPYSQFSTRIKILQTIGLVAGTIAMSVVMYIRSTLNSVSSNDPLSVLMAILLSVALLAVGSHTYALGRRFLR